MEIGNVTLRTKGLNILHCAIHPKHGLVWTDGKCIYLAKFKMVRNQVEHGKSIKLKEFDSVGCLQWSSSKITGICYLSVSHKDGVTVWKVDGEAPNLELKQIRKMSIQALPQGCLWNPHRELLCILSREQVRFFYRHGKIRGVYAIPPLESGKINCGSWSEDGLKLVVCVGSAILIYTWRSISCIISEFDTNAWKIPKLNGTITAIASMTENLFACAAEVPLASLCKWTDVFVVPEPNNPKSLNNADNDNQIIKQPDSPELSNLDKLMNLQKSPQVDRDNLSQLVIIRVKDDMKDPDYVTNSPIKELLSPDLLHYQTVKSVLVIGSNSQPRLQLFNFIKNSELMKLANVELENHSRPKGVCSIPPRLSSNNSENSMLIMLGKRSETDPAIFSSSTQTHYELWLQCFSLDHTQASNNIRQRSNQSESNISSAPSHSPRTISASSSVPSSISTSPVASPDITNKNSKPLLTKESLRPVSPELLPKCMIEELGEPENRPKELETEKVDFKLTEPNFSNAVNSSGWSSCSVSTIDSMTNNLELQGQLNGLRESTSESGYSVTSPISPTSPTIDVNGYDQNKDQTVDSGYAHLENKLRFQNDQIAELEKRIEELKRVIDSSSCVFPTTYQPVKEPDTINVIHVLDSGISIKKTFLLDHGRLHMESVKQSFGLNTIELYIDGVPIILSANIDGYIPLKFEPNSTLFIGGVTVTAADDSISVSSIASSSVFPPSPIHEESSTADLTVMGATAAAKGKATRC